ncbi:MAG TPA: hypothetical protein VFQ44_10380 [Streptosporangiaceae bacterium]|nr:hypothetical protein [Streptosporangiaceae bacterium]
MTWPARLLAAYPPSWRARYGDELDQLVEDLCGHGRMPTALAGDLLRGAALAWVTGGRFQMTERPKRALITVLWNWVAFAATAAWFGHDLAVYPTAGEAEHIALVHQGVPDSFHVLQAAGAAGVAATAVAGALFAIGAARYALRNRRPGLLALMAVPPVVAAAWLGGLQLVPHATGTAGSLGAAVGWLLLGVAGIAGSTQAVVTVVRSAEFGERTWRAGAAAGVIVTAAMVVATGATISWGLIERASQIHPGDAGGWLIVVTIMAVTTVRAVIALIGARWIAVEDKPVAA